ncbi:hypothetical protein NUSPORA_02347 [Nucleospora cyclopteri]
MFKTFFKNHNIILDKQIDIINEQSKNIDEKFNSITENIYKKSKPSELLEFQNHKDEKIYNENKHIKEPTINQLITRNKQLYHQSTLLAKEIKNHEFNLRNPIDTTKNQVKKRKCKVNCNLVNEKENDTIVSTEVKNKEEHDSNETDIAIRLNQNIEPIIKEDISSHMKMELKTKVTLDFNDQNDGKDNNEIESKININNETESNALNNEEIKALFNSTHKHKFFYKYLELFFEAQKKDKDQKIILLQKQDFFSENNLSLVLDIQDLSMLKKYTEASHDYSEIVVSTHLHKCNFAANMTITEFNRINKIALSKKMPLFRLNWSADANLPEEEDIVLAMSPKFKINHIKNTVKLGNVQVKNYIISELEKIRSVFDINNPDSYIIISKNLVCLNDKTKYKCVPIDFQHNLSILYFLTTIYGKFTYSQIVGINSDSTIEAAKFTYDVNKIFYYFPSLNMILCDCGCFDLRILSVL